MRLTLLTPDERDRHITAWERASERNDTQECGRLDRLLSADETLRRATAGGRAVELY